MSAAGGVVQSIPVDRLGAFLGHLSHDLRNQLGAIDLQAAFLAELSMDPELSEEIQKLRSMVGEAVGGLQSLTAEFQVPELHLEPLPASVLLEVFRERLELALGDRAAEFRWAIQLSDEVVSVDLEQILAALVELSCNALHFRATEDPVGIRGWAEGGFLIVEWRQPGVLGDRKPDTWGREMLLTTRRAGYGLGLYHARGLLSAHQAKLDFQEQSGSVLTRVRLSLVESGA